MKHFYRLASFLITVLFLFTVQAWAQEAPDSLYEPFQNFDLAESHSDGLSLSYAQYAWEADSFRVRRDDISKQEIVWKVNDITSFYLLVASFHWKDANHLSFFVSPDGSSYTEVTDVDYARHGAIWSWFPMVVSAHVPSGGYQYLKMEMEGEWAGDKAWTPQITSLHVNYKDTTVFMPGDDNNWSTEGNWSDGIPDYYSNVIIDAGDSVATEGWSICKNIHMGSDAKITVSSEDTLSVVNHLYIGAVQEGGQAGQVIENGTFTLYGNEIQPIINIVNQSEDHQTLTSVIAAAGLWDVLSGDGSFTLFAPSDTAFDIMDSAVRDSIVGDSAALVRVLKHHLLDTVLTNVSAIDSAYFETLAGETVLIERDTTAGISYIDGVAISDAVLSADNTSNGIVYSIDTVLVPAPPAEIPETVVDIVVESEAHDTLEAAVVAAELVDTLSGEGPFTVFAPTDDAFGALDEGVVSDLLADPTGALAEILKYHVVSGLYMAADLTDALQLKTLQGDSITIFILGGDVLIDGTAKVTAPDIESQNGVVHVIDQVLEPVLTSVRNMEFEHGSVSVYPNPASEMVTLNFSLNKAGNITVQLFDILGKQVKNMDLGTAYEGENQYQLHVGNLANGIYILRLKAGDDINNHILQIR